MSRKNLPDHDGTASRPVQGAIDIPVIADGDDFALDLRRKYLSFRRTKIVATIGPSSSSPEQLSRLIEKGMNVARINFSHGKPEEHLRTIRLIRTVSTRCGTPVAILADLCGPKIRVGEFSGGSVTLKENATVRITTKSVIGNERCIPSRYEGLVREVAVGHSILLDDGNLELKVTKKAAGHVEACVIRGGVLKNNKGMNLPDTTLHVSALTAKDRADVHWCIKGRVDYIALSFVREPGDIRALKTLLRRRGADIPVIAKIEKPEALASIKGILSIADGIMIARGDLGVELPAKKVPIIQNKLIRMAIEYNKPVIVATQMLESMIDRARPTRAEVTDVAGACLAGADAVMLSAETAVGNYPAQTVETMDSILRETEAYQFVSRGGGFDAALHKGDDFFSDAIGVATAQLSRDLLVHCIFVLTESGATARIVSSDRPAAPIIALTRSPATAGRLHLLWGVYPHIVKKWMTTSDYLACGESVIKDMKLAKKGDYVIMLSGLSDIRTKTSAIMIRQLG